MTAHPTTLSPTVKRVGAFIAAWLMVLTANSATAVAYWSATSNAFTAPAQSRVITSASSLSAAASCVLFSITPKVTLTWTASTTTFTASYDILRSTTTGGPYSQVGSAAGGASTSYTDSATLNLNTTYFYVIRARLTNWISPLSTEASASTPLVCV
jgi:hypothetical protein